MLAVLLTLARAHDHKAEVREMLDEQSLTCGSVVRLKHSSSGYHLHSHDISYGSGSTQQSVTTLKSDGDAGSLWIFKEADGEKPCRSGDPLPCGAKVRLEHMNTHKNLHSHEYSSPLSGNNEVSCYGDKGFGDNGDNWMLECQGNVEKIVGSTKFRLRHINTDNYLYARRAYKFDDSNCRGCPINGQGEVSGASYRDDNTFWEVVGGYFFPETDTVDLGAANTCDADAASCDY